MKKLLMIILVLSFTITLIGCDKFFGTTQETTIVNTTVAPATTTPATTTQTTMTPATTTQMTTIQTTTTQTTTVTTTVTTTSPREVIISFETNGGDPIVPVTILYGEQLSETIPVKINEQFIGWYTDESLTMAFDYSTQLYDNTTLYARWGDSFEIALHVNDLTTINLLAYDSNTLSDLLIRFDQEAVHFVEGFYRDEAFSNKIEVNENLDGINDIYVKSPEHNLVMYLTLEDIDVVMSSNYWYLSSEGILYVNSDWVYNFSADKEVATLMPINDSAGLYFNETVTKIIDAGQNSIIFRTSFNRTIIYGDNRLGTLGLGDNRLDDSIGIDLEALLELPDNEYIVSATSSWTTVLVSTNLGRVFSWGYLRIPDSSGHTIYEPQDVTDEFNLEDNEYFIHNIISEYGSDVVGFETNLRWYGYVPTMERVMGEEISDDLWIDLTSMDPNNEKQLYCYIDDDGAVVLFSNNGAVEYWHGQKYESETGILNDGENLVSYLNMWYYITSENRILTSDDTGGLYDYSINLLSEDETIVYSYDFDDYFMLLTSENRFLLFIEGEFQDVTLMIQEAGLSADEISIVGGIATWIHDGDIVDFGYDGYDIISQYAWTETYNFYTLEESIFKTIDDASWNLNGWITLSGVTYDFGETIPHDTTVLLDIADTQYVEVQIIIDEFSTEYEGLVLGSLLDSEDFENVNPYGYQTVGLITNGIEIPFGTVLTEEIAQNGLTLVLEELDMVQVTFVMIDQYENIVATTTANIVTGDPAYYAYYRNDWDGYGYAGLGCFADENLSIGFLNDTRIHADTTIYLSVEELVPYELTVIIPEYEDDPIILTFYINDYIDFNDIYEQAQEKYLSLIHI